MTFTDRVREELARVEVPPGPSAWPEAAGLLRAGGSLTLAGGDHGFGAVFRTGSGAVARRLRADLVALGVRPEIEVHRPGGLQRAAVYRLRLGADDAPVLVRCGLLDAEGRPAEPVSPRPASPRAQVLAYLRGAAMGALSVSEPRSAPHAELPVASRAAAEHLVSLLLAAGVTGARAGEHGEGWRVVLKSGRGIATLLAALGAHGAFLEWDAARLRAELRGEANRVTNADRANVARAVGAAARQVEAIERLVAARGWEGLPERLRPVALARVANPQASLAELGSLLDPPIGKATVHRRLVALVELAADPGGGRS